MNERRSADTMRNVLLALCALALFANLGFMWRLDVRQERLLDYGQFIGQYQSESKVVAAELDRLHDALATEQAWKSSIKANLGELLALTEDRRTREVIRLMIAAEKETDQ
jgi:hypothetical protein